MRMLLIILNQIKYLYFVIKDDRLKKYKIKERKNLAETLSEFDDAKEGIKNGK